MKHYQPGRMGMADGIGLTFVFTLSVVFLTLPSQELASSAGLAWLEVLIHSLTSLVMLFIVLYVCRHVPGDLYTVCKVLLGKWGARTVLAYFCGAFFGDCTLLLRQFAENTLLTALPYAEFAIVITAYAVIAGLLVYIGIEGISRASYLLLPFVVVSLILVLVFLSPFYNMNRLSPYAGMGFSQCITSGLMLAGVNFGILLLPLLASSFQTVPTMAAGGLFGVGLNTALHSVSVLVYTAVFGVQMGQESVLPFFAMARTIYLNRYLQHLEAFFIILWVIIGTLTIAIDLFCGLYCLTRLGNLPALRPLIPIVTIGLTQLAMVPPDIHTAIELFSSIVYYYNIGMYAVPLLLLAALLIRRKGKVKISCAAE